MPCHRMGLKSYHHYIYNVLGYTLLNYFKGVTKKLFQHRLKSTVNIKQYGYSLPPNQFGGIFLQPSTWRLK
jgi:hypothetical protein